VNQKKYEEEKHKKELENIENRKKQYHKIWNDLIVKRDVDVNQLEFDFDNLEEREND